MRRRTRNAEQLARLYSLEDGRLRGAPGWEKLPFFWFLLFLSFQCTRRCSYCYSFQQGGDGEMDDRTFSRLLEWIPEAWKANNVRVNALGFLGGEPLLRTDRIRRVMDAVYANTDGMQGFVYTNGDVIDSVHWDDLRDIQWISMNVTDIPIEELARRMKVVADRSNVIGQTIVATLDDLNLGRALEITRFGVEHGYRLRYYRNVYRGLEEDYRKRLLKTYHAVCDLLESYALRGHDIHTTFLFDTLIPLWNHETSPYHCGQRIAAVFPDGAVGPCIRNHTLKTGTIFDREPMSALQCASFRYDLKKPDLPDECRECESRTACQGGCPNDKLLLTGTTSGKSVLCDIHKEIIPRLRHLDALKKGLGSDAGAPSVA